jgi:hypothetical protein
MDGVRPAGDEEADPVDDKRAARPTERGSPESLGEGSDLVTVRSTLRKLLFSTPNVIVGRGSVKGSLPSLAGASANEPPGRGNRPACAGGTCPGAALDTNRANARGRTRKT